jgi:hypothetical protein
MNKFCRNIWDESLPYLQLAVVCGLLWAVVSAFNWLHKYIWH